jgi:probable HAF family extracellular repeat protein
LSVATGINDSGQVVGYRYPRSGSVTAFIYKDGVTRDLGTMGGGYSFGSAINTSGQVTGWGDTASGIGEHAFRYSGTPGVDGTMTDLGTLGGMYSEGFAINTAGQVVGDTYTTGDIERHAFLYTGTPGIDGQMHDLGTLGGTQSAADGINASGQIVGTSFTADGEHAFLYLGTPGVDGQMIDLDAWLKANNPIEGAKWMLSYARGISDNGFVTGEGFFNDGTGGFTSAFLLDVSSLVPEPSTIVLLAFGSLLILFPKIRSSFTRETNLRFSSSRL